MDYKKATGSVAAPAGFKASGVHCGIRHNRTKKDLALIAADVICDAAALYTQNKVKGAPLIVTKNHLQDGHAQAVICNSGNANTCNADGEDIANAMCGAVGKALGIAPGNVIVASTGVIGQPLPLEPITNAIPALALDLSVAGGEDAVEAIMTTDTRKKEIAVKFTLDGCECTIGGIAKGSGMINPNMATMLCFITTDASISSDMLHEALTDCVKSTFNMVSVDGDTSTNDMVSIMASGKAGNARITEKGENLTEFESALSIVMTHLAREVARDGEGATKLVECRTYGAADIAAARAVAKSVVSSSLVKAAMFGADANWGREMCAIGYADADVDVTKIDVAFESAGGEIIVCKNGVGIDFSEEEARNVLVRDEVKIKIGLNSGTAAASAFGCDLTYDYVKINGDYRT
jgi:glutamate N-acetyltransferase / amino-acid N-acetyltransferase